MKPKVWCPNMLRRNFTIGHILMKNGRKKHLHMMHMLACFYRKSVLVIDGKNNSDDGE
jgi:hypothetical protein